MRSQEELKQILGAQPDCFDALCEMAAWYYREKKYAGCFGMLERAIASYEAKPVESDQSRYFELKRLHMHMLRNFLPEILGPSYDLLDLRWSPIFKLGRVREMAWRFRDDNCGFIAGALESAQLRRLRYLNMTFESGANQALMQLSERLPETLRAVNMNFLEMPDPSVFMSFWQGYQQSGTLLSVTGLTLSMPCINDAMACAVRGALDKLENLTFASQDRSGMTSAICEVLADDPRSNTLLRLGLTGTSIGDQGFFVLLSSDNFEALQTLDVHDGILTNASARVLSAEHNLAHLRQIDLRYNQIDPAGIDMIIRSGVQAEVDGQHQRPENI